MSATDISSEGKEEPMPTYEYECLNCKKRFSLTSSISEHSKSKVSCPKCKSKKVKQVISTFMTKTSRKS